MSNTMRTWSDSLSKEEAQAVIRSVMGRPKTTLEGVEKIHVLTMLALVGSQRVSNNQHTITFEYDVGTDEYHVTWFPGSDDPLVEKMLQENDD